MPRGRVQDIRPTLIFAWRRCIAAGVRSTWKLTCLICSLLEQSIAQGYMLRRISQSQALRPDPTPCLAHLHAVLNRMSLYALDLAWSNLSQSAARVYVRRTLEDYHACKTIVMYLATCRSKPHIALLRTQAASKKHRHL